MSYYCLSCVLSFVGPRARKVTPRVDIHGVVLPCSRTPTPPCPCRQHGTISFLTFHNVFTQRIHNNRSRGSPCRPCYPSLSPPTPAHTCHIVEVQRHSFAFFFFLRAGRLLEHHGGSYVEPALFSREEMAETHAIHSEGHMVNPFVDSEAVVIILGCMCDNMHSDVY